MSGSSQSTGDNRLTRTFSGQSAITLCGWVKARYDKDNYGQIAVIEAGDGPGSGRDLFCGLQQDPDGSGLGDNFRFFWYDNQGGYESNGSDVISGASPDWLFIAIVLNGTSMTAYWGTTSGALSSWASGTMSFNTSDLVRAVLANDQADERADCSYRGFRLWFAALNSTEITAERDSTSFAPVRTSNLDSDIRIPNGTNPHVATTGGDWTLTGTFADDATNPSFGGGGVTSTVAGDITADFSASVTVSENDQATIAGSITADFSASISVTVSTPTVTSTVAGSITSDFTARLVATHVPSSMVLSTSGHHLVAGGQPKFLLLDAAWSMAVQLTRAQVNDYLDTRKAQGFDGVIWEMIESGTYGGPNSGEGEAPFLTPNDLTTPNPAYWDFIDYIEGALAVRTMWSWPNGLYLGYEGGVEGWFGAVDATEAQAYGAWLGARYKDHGHIVMGNYGDFLPSPITIPTAFRTGVTSAGAAQLWVNHLARNSTGTDAGDSPTLNTSYTGATNVFERMIADWAISPTLPTGLYEGHYEGSFASSPTLAAHEVRRQLWHAACAGATYVCGGHHDVWQFLSGWDSVIDTDYGATAGYLPALWNAIRWYDLEPQASGVLVTSGEGSGATYVSACKTSDGKLAVVYAPTSSSSSITVALGAMVSAVRTRWYNPRSGAYSSAGSGTYTGAGNTSFTKPDSNDWALLIEESTDVTSTVAGSITADFAAAAAVAQTITSTLAGTIAADFGAAAAVSVAPPVTSTAAGVITGDLSTASAVAQTIVGTAAGAITGDFGASAALAQVFPSTVAGSVAADFAAAVDMATGGGPVTCTVAGDCTADFAAAAAVAQTVSAQVAGAVTGDWSSSASVLVSPPVTSTIAATITSDFAFAASLTHSVSGDLVIAGAIATDFSAAATVGQTVPAGASADITADFVCAVLAQVEVQASGSAQIANDFTAGAGITLSVPATLAGELADLFVAAATITAANDVAAAVAAVITADFAATAAVGVIWNVDGSAAVDITADFTVLAVVQVGAMFTPASHPGRKVGGGTYDPRRRKV